MTHREALLKMLRDAGVRYTERGGSLGHGVHVYDSIEIEVGDSEGKPTGYWGFRTNFYFRSDGSLVDVGIWE